MPALVVLHGLNFISRCLRIGARARGRSGRSEVAFFDAGADAERHVIRCRHQPADDRGRRCRGGLDLALLRCGWTVLFGGRVGVRAVEDSVAALRIGGQLRERGNDGRLGVATACCEQDEDDGAHVTTHSICRAAACRGDSTRLAPNEQ